MHMKKQLQIKLAQAVCQTGGPDPVCYRGSEAEVLVTLKSHPRACQEIGIGARFLRMDVKIVGRKKREEISG